MITHTPIQINIDIHMPTHSQHTQTYPSTEYCNKQVQRSSSRKIEHIKLSC